ncbi:MAG: ABC transporter transmembrane domain-containing protein [Desulfobacterales bacterium]
MKTEPLPVHKRTLWSWVLTTRPKLQFLLIFIILITVFTRVVPLEMQKRVVNEAIYLRKVDLLLIYCGIYLAAVISQGALKLLINYIQAMIAQRALSEMRKELYHHILTLPLDFFRKTQPGLVVSALTTELPVAGNFVGMAISVPVTNVLTLLAFAGYLFWLNPLLAAVSLSIYPMVMIILPLLQKRANQLNKRRVDATRAMAGKIGEAVTGIHEIHGNGAYRIENTKFDGMVNKLEKIRLIWTLYTQAIKTINNFFTNLSPFLVFLLGGYLAMKGQLELGAMIAFLSAQEKLYTPWKELIEMYQVYQDAFVQYNRTMEYFDREPDYALEPIDRQPYAVRGDIAVQNLSFVTEEGIHLLDDISLSIGQGQNLALVGFSGSGKSTLAQCIGQLYRYTGGHVLLDGKEVAELSKKDMTRNVGFVSQSPFIFSGTIRENLLYGCLANADAGQDGKTDRMPSLDDIIAVLQQTGIFVDVLRFGLNTVLTNDHDQELAARVLRTRESFQRSFGAELAEYVEFFDENRYLYFSSVVENLTFGTAKRDEFNSVNLPQNTYFLRFLEEAQLARPLLNLGIRLAEQMVDILGNMPPDELLFEQSPIAPEELNDFRKVVERSKKAKLGQPEEADRTKLLELALRFTPGIHKTVALPKTLEALILEGRTLFRKKISADDPHAVTFFQISQYIYSQTILNNIFFGKMKIFNPSAQEKINQSIVHLLIEEDFLETIIEIGMQFEVGNKGDRLSGGQRQKLSIARALLKKPPVLILDEATSALDNNSQTRIQNLLENQWKGKSTLISVVHRLDIIKNFDQVAVMKSGKIGESGTYDELIARKGLLYELEYGKK